MVNYQTASAGTANLDGVFAALADPTRRAIIERLAGQPAAVGELAQDATMSLPGFMKHLSILERAGLPTRAPGIDPDRLRRLRAGLRVSALAPAKHWRCFLANATARESAFAPLRKERKTISAPPDFLARYLKVASYLAAIESRLATPTADDPSKKQRDLIGHATEELMIENFDDVKVPASLADKKLLQARHEYLLRRGKAVNVLDKTVANRPAISAKKVPLREADILGFAKALSDDPAAKKLFCRE